MKLYEYALRRIILLIFVLFAVSIIVFYLTRAALPPATAMAPFINPRMNDITKLAQAKSVGVATPSCPSWGDFTSGASGCVIPSYAQYFTWLRDVFEGDWGYSLIPGVGAGTSTWTLFISRFPLTVELALAAGILTIVFAIPLGIVSATHSNKAPDHASRILAISGYSMPIFWLGYLLQIVFVIYIRVNYGGYSIGLLQSNGVVATQCGICFPEPGSIDTYTGMPLLDALLSANGRYAWDAFVALLLPTITLAYGTLAALTRVIRSSMMEALRQDYVLMARSKGLRERTVIYRHAFRNAMLPAITISGLIFATLLGGVVITETIYSWPGIGQAALQASLYFDVSFLELYTLVTALIIVLANLGVDILYAVLDPRIKY
ncbi:MAG TPA: ABC transporter permease [Nitrososphaerales archaeon]|nr:ABC transporter permease [Nitrososphaerales archaeon]